MTIFYDFSYEELLIYRKPVEPYYSEQEIRKSTDDPTVIQFTKSFLSKKLWVKDCMHRYCFRWRKYKVMSSLENVPLEEDNRPSWKLKN